MAKYGQDKRNYWSESHMKLLYYTAKKCRDHHYRGCKDNIVLDELVSYAWLECARRTSDVHGLYKHIFKSMNKYIMYKENSLNGGSVVRMCLLDEIDGYKTKFIRKINHTADVDNMDGFMYLINLIPQMQLSTRLILIDYFVHNMTKAEIARKNGIGKCSTASRINIALRKIKIILELKSSVEDYISRTI